MKRRVLCNIVLCLLLSVAVYAQDTVLVANVDTIAVSTDTVAAPSAKPRKPKKQIYNGTTVKLDIASPIVVPAISSWLIQHYEVAVNVRLAQRYYPTLELGYSGGKTGQGDSITYVGHGGFFRAGCDINPLKKHPESPHAMLIGVRLGAAAQGSDQKNSASGETLQGVTGDCWGEIVAGCQVEICEVGKTAFYMGWMGRFKCLFTRKGQTLYIPGYGFRDTIGWGVSYHLGWRF